MSVKRFVVITAGGKGRRMKSDVPKQFVPLSGMPVLMHTIKRFCDFDKSIEIILSLPENHIDLWYRLINEHNFTVKHKVVAGGKTRFHSVKNALKEIGESGLVCVHDGVRPSVSVQTIENVFKKAEESGNAVPYCDIVFSVRKITEDGNIPVNRNDYKEIQTPQCFDVEKLKSAYGQEYSEKFTDDASVFESAGFKINLVKGNRGNIKITTPEDLIIVENLLNSIF